MEGEGEVQETKPFHLKENFLPVYENNNHFFFFFAKLIIGVNENKLHILVLQNNKYSRK